MPVSAPNVFVDCLRNNNILFFQCHFEADYELAYLANELKCPLLSCDSDFFVYDLKYGYISIDYSDFHIKRLKEFIEENPKNSYIPVKIYSIDKLIDTFQKTHDIPTFNKKMLCVFAILLGNDYVDRSIFKSLLDTFDGTNNNLKLRKLNRNLAGYHRQKNNHNKKLIKWLVSWIEYFNFYFRIILLRNFCY